MELNRIQFDILSTIAENNSFSIDGFSNKTTYSIQDIKKEIDTLNEEEYISDFKVTSKGLLALEPYKVKRAIFLAAGVGERLQPITINTPKPLVRVFGIRIIDRLIDAVLSTGIEEIIIVRGYLAEQFNALKNKYPTIKFIDNPFYSVSNNIASVLQVRELLENAYVFESDLLLYNPAIIRKYHYSSNFLGIMKESSNDWCFSLKDGYICEEKIGGNNCYQMVGISYWNKEDGKKLYNDIKEAYEMQDGKQLYWEQVPLTKFKNNYKVYVIECKENDIIEIDTFSELKEIDNSYI